MCTVQKIYIDIYEEKKTYVKTVKSTHTRCHILTKNAILDTVNIPLFNTLANLKLTKTCIRSLLFSSLTCRFYDRFITAIYKEGKIIYSQFD